MIQIDFQGGAHGNYLEFVCNTMCGITGNNLPFNPAGASHSKQYIGKKVFHAGHFSYLQKTLAEKIVSIQIAEDDLLPLAQISLLRSGDYGYDNNYLEIDTYNKLNNQNYRWALDKLIDGFFKNQILTSYNNVRDQSWPDVTTLQEFEQLPEHIRNECQQVHNLELLELSTINPDCPRSILREFFQLGFENPNQHGFMHLQNTMLDYSNRDVYIFPFSCFYKSDQFVQQLKQIAEWAGIQYNQHDRIVELHEEFLSRQPYATSKIRCDAIVQNIIQNLPVDEARDLLEESYINSQLKKYGHERRY
jgi:hypothetical protein